MYCYAFVAIKLIGLCITSTDAISQVIEPPKLNAREEQRQGNFAAKAALANKSLDTKTKERASINMNLHVLYIVILSLIYLINFKIFLSIKRITA